MPLCKPDAKCDDKVRLIAGEGSPMPLCKPDAKCDDKVRLIAGEGSPMPLCKPDSKCDDKLRLDDALALQANFTAPQVMDAAIAMAL
jgi:hypothetical protein